MLIDDNALKPRNNNLTLLRLILASAVIWTHSVWRLTGVEGVDELSPWLGAPISSFAVDGFFFLSGLLVYSSLLRRDGVLDYLSSRLARLWPGLAVAVLATVAVGAFVTTAHGLAYLGGATAKFIVGNLTLTVGSYRLTGIGCGADLCNINGSLWTITWEVRCYLLLAALALVGLAKPVFMRRFVLPASFVVALALHVPGMMPGVERHLGKAVVFNLAQIDRLWTMFALGIAAYVWRDRIKLSWWACAALLAATMLAARYGFDQWHVRSVFTGYAVLCVGFLSARRGAISGTWPDYSYGMYIYAFPVMMAVAALVPFMHHVWLALLNFVLTLPLAALSWHFVEEPVLELVRSRRLRNRAPPEVVAVEPAQSRT